jgi:hypothetical protein
MCREGGGKGSPGVITLMNPGPYRPFHTCGRASGAAALAFFRVPRILEKEEYRLQT